jgi:2-haloacid dehalogenase
VGRTFRMRLWLRGSVRLRLLLRDELQLRLLRAERRLLLLSRRRRSKISYDAVLFDLFTALLDSRPLWHEVAGSAVAGASWREESSRVAYSAGPYRPFVETVAEAARRAGVPPARAADLLRGMGEQLEPWPEAPEVLGRLGESVRIGVVTNCAEELGQRAAARVGVRFDTVATAEAAGAYKPRPEPYMLALDRLGVQPSRALFVAGSPSDIAGARGAGMDVWWHNRLQLSLGEHQAPLAELDSLEPLLALATERACRIRRDL